MNNRRKPSSVSYLDGMTGHRMLGGCDDCDAYQTLTREGVGMYRLLVHHDATCPFYRSMPR